MGGRSTAQCVAESRSPNSFGAPGIGLDAEGELILLGSYFPFAATKNERLAANDPRPSLEERYPASNHYLNLISRAAAKLKDERLLLGEDVERIVKAAAARIGK